MYIPVKNTVKQISYFYVDQHRFIHYYDGDERQFDKHEIGSIQVFEHHVALYNQQGITIYTAKFEGSPSEMYRALSQYQFPLVHDQNI